MFPPIPFVVRTPYTFTITSNETNYDLKSDVDTRTGGTTDTYDSIEVTIDSGVVVASDATGTAAFDVGTGWLSTQNIVIVNDGTITGKGGAGGTGASMNAAGNGNPGGTAFLGRAGLNSIDVTNNGTIQSGGGGGGGGRSPQTGYSLGGGGGGGAGSGAGNTGGSGGSGGSGGFANGNGGAAGTATGQAGGSGGSHLGQNAGAGGLGGNPGVDGADGGNPSSGGSRGGGTGGTAGHAIDGFSYITYTENGTKNGGTNG